MVGLNPPWCAIPPACPPPRACPKTPARAPAPARARNTRACPRARACPKTPARAPAPARARQVNLPTAPSDLALPPLGGLHLVPQDVQLRERRLPQLHAAF